MNAACASWTWLILFHLPAWLVWVLLAVSLAGGGHAPYIGIAILYGWAGLWFAAAPGQASLFLAPLVQFGAAMLAWRLLASRAWGLKAGYLLPAVHLVGAWLAWRALADAQDSRDYFFLLAGIALVAVIAYWVIYLALLRKSRNAGLA